MGLFSFLSRKSGTKAKGGTLTKPPPLVSSNPGPLPSRDEYPLPARAGAPLTIPHRAGPSAPPAHHHAPDSSDSDSDSDADSISDAQPAPGPSIPLHRAASPSRPSTAPSSARPSSLILLNSRPRLSRPSGTTSNTRPPPLSFRMIRPGTAAATTSSRPTSVGSLASAAASLPAAHHHHHHGRSNSLRGDGTKAFKDILDAQSEIKPADFRARVQAAGARDYGEDVAERNMGENGVELGAAHVRAFYYERRCYQGAAGGGVAQRGSMSVLEGGGRAGRAGVRRLGLRGSQGLETTAGRMSSPEPMMGGGRELGRRRSELAAGWSAAGERNFLSRSSITSLGSLGSRGSSGRMRSRGVGSSAAEHLGFPAQGLTAPGVLHPLDTAPAPTVRTARRARGVAESAPAEDAVGEDWAGDFALWSATRLRRSATILSSASGPRKHHSLHGVRSSISSMASRETLDHVTPLAYPPKTTTGHSSGRESSLSHTRNYPLATPPTTTAALDMALPDEDALDFPPPIRTRSMRGWSASSSTPTAAESIATTSVSITTSSFHRAPSLRTADTSVVDLDAGAPSLRLKPSLCFSRNDSITPASDFSDSDREADDDDHDMPHPHLHPIPPRKTSTPAAAVRPPTVTTTADFGSLPDLYPLEAVTSSSSASSINPPNPDSDSDSDASDDETTAREVDAPTNLNGDNFNIDDYLSSDAASVTTPPNRRPTADGEEELLFDDGGGFGAGGMELPGLNEAFSVTGLSSVGVGGEQNEGRKREGGKSVGFEGDLDRDGVDASRRRTRRKHSAGWERARRYVPADSDTSCSSPSSRESGSSDSDSDWSPPRHKHHHPHPRRRRRSSHHTIPNQVHPRRRSSLLPPSPPIPSLTSPPTSPNLSRAERHQRRLSALQRLEGGIHHQTQPHPLHPRAHTHTHHALLGDETGTAPETNDEDKVAAAVRLRKEVMRARRLAGKPSAAGLRRKGSAKLGGNGMGKGVAVWER